MELQKGRPQSGEVREDRELRTYDFLDRLGIAYERVDHAHADTMEDCRRIEEVLEAPVCKNLLLCNRQGTMFYLLLMPGDKPFRTKELSAQIGSARLSFASAEKMVEYLNIHPGALSVMGLMNDTEHQVQLLIDEDVLAKEWLGCHPCVNTSTLRMKTEDMVKIFLPAVKHGFRTVHLVGEEPT